MISSLLWGPIFHFTTIKTADHRVFKMALRCIYGRFFAERWGILPIGTHWAVFNAFQWAFLFHLMRITLYSDFAGTDYPRQVRHHCSCLLVSCELFGQLGWRSQAVGYVTVKLTVPLGEERTSLALGKLYSSRVILEEGNGVPLLKTLYLEYPGKCHH